MIYVKQYVFLIFISVIKRKNFLLFSYHKIIYDKRNVFYTDRESVKKIVYD